MHYSSVWALSQTTVANKLWLDILKVTACRVRVVPHSHEEKFHRCRLENKQNELLFYNTLPLSEQFISLLLKRLGACKLCKLWNKRRWTALTHNSPESTHNTRSRVKQVHEEYELSHTRINKDGFLLSSDGVIYHSRWKTRYKYSADSFRCWCRFFVAFMRKVRVNVCDYRRLCFHINYQGFIVTVNCVREYESLFASPTF